MEKKIDKLVKILKLEYILFWCVTVLLVVSYEMGSITEGSLVGDGRSEYILQMMGVVMTIVFLPMSLKVFSVVVKRWVRFKSEDEALKSYRRWSEIRLALLLITVLFNLNVYYQILDTSALLCAGMGLLTSLFCVPGVGRVMTELDKDTEEEA